MRPSRGKGRERPQPGARNPAASSVTNLVVATIITQSYKRLMTPRTRRRAVLAVSTLAPCAAVGFASAAASDDVLPALECSTDLAIAGDVLYLPEEAMSDLPPADLDATPSEITQDLLS